MTSKKLNKTGIEYGDLAWNPYPGCSHKPMGICPVSSCWAEGMWKRQMGTAAKKGIILPDFHHPHLIPERLLAPLSVKKPSRILVNFMGDLFGDWVDPNLQHMGRLEFPVSKVFPKGWLMLNAPLKSEIFTIINACPQHTFIFLTKNPAGLIPWSPFPENCYIGVSITDNATFAQRLVQLKESEATVKFISFEPLLGQISQFHYLPLMLRGIQWVIIGVETKNGKIVKEHAPKIEWISEIVEAADKAGVKVFLKNNMVELLKFPDHNWAYAKHANGIYTGLLRQEFPSQDRKGE